MTRKATKKKQTTRWPRMDHPAMRRIARQLGTVPRTQTARARRRVSIGKTRRRVRPVRVTAEEAKFLTDYRSLDPEGRQRVTRTFQIQMLIEACVRASRQNQIDSVDRERA